MTCKKWELKFMMRKVKNIEELADYIVDEFSNVMILRLVKEKLDLLISNPFKVAREKLGKDKYGNLMFSIEVTGDIRILYSVDPKNCIVFIWEIGSHKKVYGP